MSLVGGLMVIGSCATAPRVTLQGHTISTLTGQKSTWDHRTLDRQTEFFTISGKRARLIQEVMECATSRTDGLVSPSWEARRLFTKLRSPGIPDSEFYLNLEEMQRRCSLIKLYQYQQIIRSSLKPIQDGMERPKTELSYKTPSRRLTRGTINEASTETQKGLDTTIDWKNTGDNSYDGEKLRLLVHDESGKWEKPDNILNNWRVTKTCLRLGAKIVGKCMMGSTSNALNKGGDNFKKLYYDSNVTKRNRNGQTASGLYALFIPMEWNYEGFIDKYGYPVFDTPETPVEGVDGELIRYGVIEHWENEADGLKGNNDGLNEFYRQFPRYEKHAFRDEIAKSLFNLNKIYEQIDFNEEMVMQGYVTRGSFSWKNGVKDSEVEFHPNKTGRFKLSWIPPVSMQNNIIVKNGIKYPGNQDLGAFGCDSYDISGTTDGSGSNGALHGLTAFSMLPEVPSSQFFLEYVARPQTAEIFFEDVLMAMIFYGMPILAENNKPRLLYHIKRRGYRGYSMNRPDKSRNKLSVTEKELGGIPNSSEDIRQAHAAAIESYIENHVGIKEDGACGRMYFQRTLEDWSKFDINKRTKFDASISSGLAIMACQRHLYASKKYTRN